MSKTSSHAVLFYIAERWRQSCWANVEWREVKVSWRNCQLGPLIASTATELCNCDLAVLTSLKSASLSFLIERCEVVRCCRNKSVFSFLRTLTTWHWRHIRPLHAAAAAIDRYLLHARPTAACLQQRVCCCRLEQTDGRTFCRFIDHALHTMWAVPKIAW